MSYWNLGKADVGIMMHSTPHIHDFQHFIQFYLLDHKNKHLKHI